MTSFGRCGVPGPVLLVVLLAGIAAGCSTAQDPGNPVNAQGSHPAGFVSTHPSLARPSGAACTPCHGDDLRGGISRVSCSSASRNGVACHAGGPAFHPQGWVDCTSVLVSRAAWHATAYQDNVLVNGTACAGCHAPPALDNATSGFCVRCHFTISGARVPPGSSWVHGTYDGHAFGDNAARAVCMACHDAHNRFGQQPSCHNCHEPYPAFNGHPASWLDCTSRGTNGWHATAYGNNLLVDGKRCDQCHTLNTRCTMCHFDIGGRKVPIGSSYSHPDNDVTHWVFGADNAAWPVCVACHDTHRQFGQPPTCAFHCH